MQIETTEINGFTIDEFNVHKLAEGKTQGICPLCSIDRKKGHEKAKCASYDWKRGIVTCHNCNTSTQMHTFLRKGATEKIYARPPIEETLLIGTKVEEWFKGRGISRQTLVDMKVSEGLEWMPQTQREENAIKFNYFIGDQLINIKSRDGRKNFKLHKGAEKIFYNINSTVGYEEVIIVEGEIDALALHEAGIKSVVSVPNGATVGGNNLDYLDNCIDYFEDKTKVIIATDNDKAGEALQQELVRRLGAEVCFIVSLDDCNDANEYLLKHGKEKLQKCIAGAKPVPLENVVQFKDIEDEVSLFVREGFKPGYQIGLPDFDSIFSTYTSQFVVVTGVPSSGKSDFVDMMTVGYNRNYGFKTAYASPENAPTYLHAHKLMRKIWNKLPTAEDINSPEWKEVAEKVNENFFFIDMEKYSLDSILRKGAELVRRKGIKVLVIDPFNKVRNTECKSEDVNRYTMEYLSKIETFAKKFDVLVFLVAHPTKMYQNPNDGKMQEPTMYNIKGGGEFYDASPSGLLVHRDYESKTVKVKVLKVKFQNLGENQAETHFTWDPASGNYVPAAIPVIDDSLPW